jgi:hypothetical protein
MSTIKTATPTDSVGVTDQAIPLSSFSYANATATTSVSQTYTITPPYTYSTGSAPWVSNTTASPWLGNGISSDPNGTGKLKLNGDGADVEINGVSLTKAIKDIQERLNILTVNPELEKEWDQLRELGEQYRALEAKLKEQGKMWDKLKAMPPPVID